MRSSVVIPTKNRRRELEALLVSLSNATPVPGGQEIIVVNDGGESISDLDARYGVKTVVQSSLGVAAARNRGVEEASGEFVLFTDDDCRAEREWIALMTRRLESEDHVLVIGTVRNGLPENPWAETNQRLHDAVVEWFNSQRGGRGFFTGNNFSLRRRDWLALGGMAADWRVCGGEEREFAARWKAAGGRVEMEKDAVIWHYHALTAGKFLNQQFRYGRGARFAGGPKASNMELYRRILTSAPTLAGRSRLAASQAAVMAGWLYEAVLGRKQKALAL